MKTAVLFTFCIVLSLPGFAQEPNGQDPAKQEPAAGSTEATPAPTASPTPAKRKPLPAVLAGKTYYYDEAGKTHQTLNFDRQEFGYYPRGNSACDGVWPLSTRERRDGRLDVFATPPPGFPHDCVINSTGKRAWTFRIEDGGQSLVSNTGLVFKVR